MRILKVVIVDYGMGNLKSVENAIKYVGGCDVTITCDHDLILAADVLVLPGVGAFHDAMGNIKNRGLLPVLSQAVQVMQKPTLGICLGMQLLFETSEEKLSSRGLGWIAGKVAYMKPSDGLRIPHIGWNSLQVNKNFEELGFFSHDLDYYFVHSLHVVCDEKFVLARFDYGGVMTAAVKDKNIVGMQFHPEKSHKNGLATLTAFLHWARQWMRNKRD